MDIEQIKNRAEKEIKSVQNIEELKNISQKYLGKKGEITLILRLLKDLSEQEKKKKGAIVNQFKKKLLNDIRELEKKFQQEIPEDDTKEWIDVSLPGKKSSIGHLHPITQVKREVEDIFERLGFSVVEGPEIETEKYNSCIYDICGDNIQAAFEDNICVCYDLDMFGEYVVAKTEYIK